MYFSVRKLSNLVSVKRSTPQRFILWQAITVLIFKFMFIVLVLTCLWGSLDVMIMLVSTTGLDIFSTPLIVELSYIGCNKRNMKTLFTGFSFRKFIRVLFDIEENVHVEQRF
ncbi:Serpentine receptor class gamma [Caenorhabditis elegans]|nr:Serpentine receptor class gamma [Caenorhabditis elegans]CAJ76925.1 Serpentine receptor class gamma [Caenorhabditis elegans]|eukprot:NP_001040922.1 Serpentine Receptor, class Z [Caenorhabditis elegans]